MFKPYQHIERFGTDEVEGINIGKCYIFPKIDGTNGSIWVKAVPSGVGCFYEIACGSRKRELSLDNDNAGFMKAVVEDENLIQFMKENPTLRLFGEWLVPHSLKTYRNDAWKKFYVFDVMEGETYLRYEEYNKLLEEYGINYIPVQCIINNPTEEQLMNQLAKNVFLVEDGKGQGEGIVIKNYDFVNKYGRVTWAKIVTNEFKEKHWRSQPIEMEGKKVIEEEMVEKYLTEEVIEKEFSKLINEVGTWNSKMIPRLLGTIWNVFINEEIWTVIKKYKNPVIDFRKLQQYVNLKIKRTKSNLF